MNALNFSLFIDYENPLIRVFDFNLIKKFIVEKTTIDFKNVKSMELGAGEGWFSVIALSHGWIAEGIDININLDSVNKFGYVEYCDCKKIKFKSKYNVVHSNMFQYMSNSEIESFFKSNIQNIDLIFITMSTKIKKSKIDKFRTNFTDECFFVKIAKRYDLHYEGVFGNSKRILCKKGVLIDGA